MESPQVSTPRIPVNVLSSSTEGQNGRSPRVAKSPKKGSKKKQKLKQDNLFLQICCCCFLGSDGRDKNGEKKPPLKHLNVRQKPEIKQPTTVSETSVVESSQSHTPTSQQHFRNRLEEIAHQNASREEIVHQTDGSGNGEGAVGNSAGAGEKKRNNSLTTPSTLAPTIPNSKSTIGEV